VNLPNAVIVNLMNALDAIQREAHKPTASRHYILGVCEQAIRECNAVREQNADGYLVVPS
jgi:hypothetical protein